MSDYNSSLPVRTENAGDVIIKVADATVTSQQLAINSDGSVNITDNGGSITVDGSVTVSATDLDIRDLAFATDKVDVSGSDVTISNTVAVSATDLDIRDLSAAQDSVSISDGTDTLAINTDGSLNVALAAGAEVKITDGTDDLAINADGSLNAVVTATDLDVRDLAFATDKVDVTGSDVTVSGTVTVAATDLDIRDLAFATEKVDVSGSSVTVSATDLDIRDLDSATDSVTVVATDLDVRDLAFATDKVDVSGSTVTATATDLDIRDLSAAQDSVKIGDGTDFLAVNADGSINVVTQEDPGTEVVNYNTASAIAAAASSNHDLVVTNGGRLYQVWASASGKLKAEVQIETGASTNVFNTVIVGFNSTADTNIDMSLAKYALIPTGARVRVIRTNRDNQSQDVYSTIVLIQS